MRPTVFEAMLPALGDSVAVKIRVVLFEQRGMLGGRLSSHNSVISLDIFANVQKAATTSDTFAVARHARRVALVAASGDTLYVGDLNWYKMSERIRNEPGREQPNLPDPFATIGTWVNEADGERLFKAFFSGQPSVAVESDEVGWQFRRTQLTAKTTGAWAPGRACNLSSPS